jgi:hypothetical protein
MCLEWTKVDGDMSCGADYEKPREPLMGHRHHPAFRMPVPAISVNEPMVKGGGQVRGGMLAAIASEVAR